MPGKHKEPTIAFRPSAWERAIIEQRAALSGMHKKDFIARSCVYSNIVVVGKKENIQRIVDALQEMQTVMREIAGQMQSGDFALSKESYQELKRDYLALAVTVVDIVDHPENQRNLKAELELEQYRSILELDENNSRNENRGVD